MPGSVLKWLVVVVIVLVLLLVATGSTLVGTFPNVRDTVGDLVGRTGARGQSPAQISPAEFERTRTGMSTKALEALVGRPDGRSTNEVEGLRIECWYYGIGAASGSYQLCFVNDRLRSRFRYER